VVVACGGVVDKYIGDCVMSVWDMSDGAAAACQASRAAYAIREAVRQFNRAAAPPAPLNVHSGIASGPLMAGQVGGALTGTFSVIGEPVVPSQSLEEASPPGQIYVDAATQSLAGSAIDPPDRLVSIAGGREQSEMSLPNSRTRKSLNCAFFRLAAR
jgi:adenylate cyclase